MQNHRVHKAQLLGQIARKDYGETRVICYGLLEGRMIVVGYTPRGADRHVFSMRKANEREQKRIAPLLKV
ncbi:MAG: BrnT family toxin [Sideroxyarcus sp.]|nr:BrnT family toxin [Sideroxyarcus sp.]